MAYLMNDACYSQSDDVVNQVGGGHVHSGHLRDGAVQGRAGMFGAKGKKCVHVQLE